MIISTSSITFVGTYGGGNPSSQTFSITNGVCQAFQIDNTVDWNANKSQNWLSVSPSSGNVSGTTPVSVTVSVNVAGLGRGTYSDVIGIHSTMVSSRQWETISVTLNIADPLSASISGPTSLGSNQMGTYTATVSGGATPYSYQWWKLEENGGAAPVSFTVSPNRPPNNTWVEIGTNSPTVSTGDIYTFEIKCVVTDPYNRSVTSSIISVSISGSANFLAGTPMIDAPVVSDYPKENSLSQNYPNPFNPSTQIRFALSKPAYVKLTVYDLLGRNVAQLADEQMEAGYHAITWNADKLPSGVYIHRFSADNLVEVKRMVVLK